MRAGVSFYGVPSPPKSKLVTQHPTLPLSTSDFTVNIELCCYQQRTLQLSTSNYWLNIRHYSYQQRTIGSTSDFSWLFVTQHPTAQLSTSHYWLNIRHYSYQQRTLSRQQNKMFDFAKRHVRLRKVRCWVLFVRAKSADNYGIARMTSLWQSLALVWTVLPRVAAAKISVRFQQDLARFQRDFSKKLARFHAKWQTATAS